MLDLDAIWLRRVEQLGLAERRPNFQFDAEFYLKKNSELNLQESDAAWHFDNQGRFEGRPPNLYHSLKHSHPGLELQIPDILTDSELVAAVQDNQPDALELAFELLALPGGMDSRISDFSAEHYLTKYFDVKAAGIHPLVHFLAYGKHEKRVWLRTLRRNFYKGEREFDPSKPTIFLIAHEFSNTGAPAVALQLLREAAQTRNVIVLALQGGMLLDRFKQDAVSIFITHLPHEEVDFVLAEHLPSVSYALLNSTDSSPFVRMLVARGIPFGVYMHEYTQYSLPLMKTIWPTLYADVQIFSSETVRDSWRGIHADLGFDTDRLSTIIPQAELRSGRVLPAEHREARRRIGRALGVEIGERRLIYGAGSVHWRKGSDLFVLAAQIGHAIDPQAIWVWIGDGMNHEDFHSGVWQETHMLAADANQPDGYFFHLPAGPCYSDLCVGSDVFMLASRMDPLPNVVFDAVAGDCDVVMFKGASGFDDSFYDAEPRFHRVPFGRVDLAARAALTPPPKMRRPRPYPDTGCNAEGPGLFDKIETALLGAIEAQKTFCLGHGDYDLPVLFSERADDAPARLAEMQKTWSLGRRTVWKSADEARAALKASGHPVHASAQIAPYGEMAAQEAPSFSIHIHAFYTDDLQLDMSSYDLYRFARQIVVTTDADKKAREIEGIADSLGLRVEIRIIENQGRDILPFMKLIEATEGEANEIWAHVHQKKSLTSTPGGDAWRNFLVRNLFGGKGRISDAISHFEDPEVGLVTPFDPFIVGWFGSKRILPIYQRRVPTRFPEHPLLFPVGNMFWTRRSVVNQMNSYFGPDFPWPNEPIANDGTVFHLIERLWPTAAYEAGLRSVFVSKPDQSRR